MIRVASCQQYVSMTENFAKSFGNFWAPEPRNLFLELIENVYRKKELLKHGL